MKIQYILYVYLHCIRCFVTPSNYFAVVNGGVSDSALLRNVTNIDAFSTCARLCEDRECKSFMHNSDSKMCSTFTTGLSISSGPLISSQKYFQKGNEVVNCAPINVYGKWAKCNIFNSKRWTIVQRRYDGTVTFDKLWDEFKEGFGDLDGEYWIGNEALHRLTHEHNQTAMFVIEDWNGVEKYAQYDNFKVSSEEDKYRLTVSGYSGTAGDSMQYHNEQQFSTRDNDNDKHLYRSCSEEYGRTGYWFKMCLVCNINGRYLMGNVATPHALVWNSFSGEFRPMKKSRMMLRPSP